MSNTKKITANKKNRREKGCRALFSGSNPHSNGVDFSRNSCDRIARNKATEHTASGKIILRVAGI